jgi:hypothetical protein
MVAAGDFAVCLAPTPIRRDFLALKIVDAIHRLLEQREWLEV